jgi:hypothetical protein
MTLEQKIQECNEKTARIIEQDPTITGVWFKLEDCSYKEMKELNEKQGGGYLEPAEDKMKMLIRSRYTTEYNTIFAYSKPLKIITTVEVIETPEVVEAMPVNF